MLTFYETIKKLKGGEFNSRPKILRKEVKRYL